MYKKLLIGLIIFILCLSPIAAENWNSFAGDVNHNAYRDESSDFVTNLWTFNMGSPVHSSPAIYKDNVYVVSQDGILKAIDMDILVEEAISMKISECFNKYGEAYFREHQR